MPEIRHVDANGLRFAYLEDGRGPLILLLHGFPDTARSWDHTRARLAAKGYRAVSPWLRGYAPTAIPARDADVETLGRDALALIAALGETAAVVVGHDWGAAVAWHAALLRPDLFRAVVGMSVPYAPPGRIDLLSSLESGHGLIAAANHAVISCLRLTVLSWLPSCL